MIPTEAQSEAIRTLFKTETPVVWAGAIRSGKTVGGCYAFVLKGQMKPCDFIFGGVSYTTILRNTQPVLEGICRFLGIRHKYYPSRKQMTIGKSTVHYFGAPNDTSQDQVQGMTADGALLDEAALQPQSFVMQVIARCSNPDPIILMTLNKTSPYHWLKRDLIDGGKVKLVESLTTDNPHIGKETIELYETMFSGHFRKRMLENEWAAATGRVFGDPAKADIPESGEEVIAVDAAQSGTTAALYFRRKGQQWIIFDEYYAEGEFTPDFHARNIGQRAGKNATIIIDPTGVNLRLALRQEGFLVENANNDIDSGVSITQAAIEHKRVLMGFRGTEPAARNLLEELDYYVWDEKAALQGVDKPIKKRDHLADCLRYFCRRHCQVGTAPIPKPKGL